VDGLNDPIMIRVRPKTLLVALGDGQIDALYVRELGKRISKGPWTVATNGVAVYYGDAECVVAISDSSVRGMCRDGEQPSVEVQGNTLIVTTSEKTYAVDLGEVWAGDDR